MDDVDRGQEREQLDREIAIRERKPAGPSAVGVCLYCDTVLGGGLRWCDVECERAWEYERARNKANGRHD